jgi:hypothetical protein
VNHRPLINRTEVRRLAIAAGNSRLEGFKPAIPRRFSRVSAAFLDEIESRVRIATEQRAREHWQKGKTLV